MVGCKKRRTSASDDGSHSSPAEPAESGERTFSPTELFALKLDKFDATCLYNNSAAAVELKGSELETTENAEELLRHREKLRMQASDPENFDYSGRTMLNLGPAASAGAKLAYDESVATRSKCKELCRVIDEDSLLYKPIQYSGKELKSVQELGDSRQASVAEVFVDFRSQIKFKASVLKHLEEQKHSRVKERAKTDTRVSTRQQKENERFNERKRKRDAEKTAAGLKTPKMSQELNPLDGNRIVDAYALEVASDVRDMAKKRRHIAPIPFDIHLLDDEED